MRIFRPYSLILFLLTACNPAAGPAAGTSTTVWLDPHKDPEGPFPTDDYTVYDLTMATGLRLDFTGAKPKSLPMRAIQFFDRADFHMTQNSLETIDGSSSFAPISST